MRVDCGHGQGGYIDPRLFEDYPQYLHPLEEVPIEIKSLLDDWDASIPTTFESLCNECDLVGIVVAINMEPLALEYEGYDNFTYTLDFKFTNVANWRVKCVHSMDPQYFVLEE